MTTGIQWTDETWNPVVGCAHVSPGCDGCYAAREAFGRLSAHPIYAGLAERRFPDELPRFTGEIRLLDQRLDQPLRWRRQRRVFVNSMSDLFHPDIPDQFIADVFARMALARRHTFQILTKRPARMSHLTTSSAFEFRVARSATDIIGATGSYDRWTIETGLDWTPLNTTSGTRWHPPWPLPNVWLGTSIESDRYRFRATQLAQADAAIRFLSIEPLLGPVDLDLNRIHWVIVGAESGPRARQMDDNWARQIRDQCADAGVAFFVKQLSSDSQHPLKELDDFPSDLRIREYPR